METKFLIPVVFLMVFVNYPGFALWEQPKDIQLFMQIQIRDSDGTLVAYIEGKPRIFTLDVLVQWLESVSQKSTITKDGKTYEVLRYSAQQSFLNANTMGGYYVRLPVNGITDIVMYMDHGSYHVKKDDTSMAYFTLIRQP